MSKKIVVALVATVILTSVHMAELKKKRDILNFKA